MSATAQQPASAFPRLAHAQPSSILFGHESGNSSTLLHRRPLKTVFATFTAHGSSSKKSESHETNFIAYGTKRSIKSSSIIVSQTIEYLPDIYFNGLDSFL